MQRKKNSQELGTEDINKLLVKMAVPASIGILVMSIYFIVDTIFVGQFVGTLGIAAITVVMPITFLISSMGMAIGVGGSSIISRALGGGNREKAYLTFGNMISMSLLLLVTIVMAGAFFEGSILFAFGAQGEIMSPASEYFRIILVGVPALGWAMMSNNVMRAEGEARMAMLVMMIPAVVNIILDPILIIWLDWGLAGAAWATTISYYMSALFAVWFFVSGRSDLKIKLQNFVLQLAVIKEIASIGVVTLARQGAISLLTIVLNHSLFTYGSSMAVAIYGIINRITMFANFPVLGITQGFLPIAGYNYGAEHWKRVRDIIQLSIRSGTLIAFGLFSLIMIFSSSIVSLFTSDPALLEQTPGALRLVFLATPLITVQLVGAAYFQAIGKARPALLLTLTKQGFFLIPLVFVLPQYFGLMGIWYSFPLSDLLAAGVTYWYLRREVSRTLEPKLSSPSTNGKEEIAAETIPH
ncbi:MAG: MATE family efflux transporter [Saprospiraceae bacterium]|nr:MATE family efflux transporter [Saprospiraceae bacterium]